MTQCWEPGRCWRRQYKQSTRRSVATKYTDAWWEAVVRKMLSTNAKAKRVDWEPGRGNRISIAADFQHLEIRTTMYNSNNVQIPTVHVHRNQTLKSHGLLLGLKKMSSKGSALPQKRPTILSPGPGEALLPFPEGPTRKWSLQRALSLYLSPLLSQNRPARNASPHCTHSTLQTAKHTVCRKHI